MLVKSFMPTSWTRCPQTSWSIDIKDSSQSELYILDIWSSGQKVGIFFYLDEGMNFLLCPSPPPPSHAPSAKEDQETNVDGYIWFSGDVTNKMMYGFCFLHSDGSSYRWRRLFELVQDPEEDKCEHESGLSTLKLPLCICPCLSPPQTQY